MSSAVQNPFALLRSILKQGRTGNLYDEFNFWDIEDGVMFLKDGRAEVGVSLQLLPSHYAPEPRYILRMLSALLRDSPTGARVRWCVTKRPANPEELHAYYEETSTPSEKIVHLARERSRETWELMKDGHIAQWEAFVSVCYGKRLGKDLNALNAATRDALKKEGRLIQLRISRYLSQLGFKYKPMDTQDVLQTVFAYLNPSQAHERFPNYESSQVLYPEKLLKETPDLRPPTLRAKLLQTEVDNSYRDKLMVGAVEHRMVSLYTEPESTAMSQGNLLLRGGNDMSVIVDMTHEPKERTVSRVKNFNSRISTALHLGEIYVGRDVSDALEEGEEMLTFFNQNGDHAYKTSICLIARGRDSYELEQRVNRIKTDLSEISGAPFRILAQGLFKPWKSCTPFNGEQHDERVTLVETNVAHLLPYNGPWTGSARAVAPFVTEHDTLVYLDTFDPRNKNAHSLFLGGTRQGKTHTAQFVLQQTLRDDSVDAIIIDRGLSWQRTVDLFDGVTIKVEPGGEYAINMFDLPEGELRPSDEKKTFLKNVLRAMLPVTDVTREADENAILTSAIAESYQSALIEKPDGRGGYVEDLEPFTLSGFIDSMQTLSAVGKQPVTEDDLKVIASMSKRLSEWTGDTPLGTFLDRPTNVPVSTARVTLYETSSFDKEKKLDVVGTMLLQEGTWKRAKNKQRKLVLIMDEAWAILQNPSGRAYLNEFQRRGAKEGVAVWLITHSIFDLMGERVNLIKGISRFFLFKVGGEERDVQDALQLPDEVMEDYGGLSGEKGVYNQVLFVNELETGRESAVLTLRNTRAEYWTSTNHVDDLALIERYTHKLGSEAKAIQALSEGVAYEALDDAHDYAAA